jgi:small subunit ribosomal protein S1
MLEEAHDVEKARTSENDSTKGGEKKKEGGVKLRSPAYASFERLDIEEMDEARSVESTEFSDFLESLESSFTEFEEEKIVKGTVTEVHENEVIVDVGFKSEGAISISEFRDRDEIKVGDEVEVFLEKLENQDGLVVLSKEKADFFRVWDEIKNAYENGKIMEGRIARRIKGGLVVDLLGVDAFLPGSQIALRQVPNLDELIGQTLQFKIIKINRRRRNIVVSRRIVLEEERADQKRKLLAELEIGQIREGVVKNITDFGAFVDLGGVDGLLHLTDMTWGRISHPSEVVAIGNNLKVKILDFDREKEKISLGLKQLTPYPWDGVEERYPVGNKVRGKVVSITDYGAFVELEKGVEGLIHISEMSWTRHVKHPSKVLAIGETVDVMVLRVDKDNQKISLGLKQIEPDPWSTIEEKYPVGTRLSGKVRNLTNFGAFVEIEDGIDGLLHISDMSWAKRVRHPSEVVKKGDKIDVVVLDISQEKKRISLGMKQLTDNPWNQLAEEFAPDTVTEGKITRILERGAVVEIRDDVEGFVPIGQMGKENLRHPEDCFAVGDVIPLKVMKVDPKNKRIVLSVSLYLKTLDEEGVKEFHERFPVKAREEQQEEGASEAAGEAARPEEPTEVRKAEAGDDSAADASAKSEEENPPAETPGETGDEAPSAEAEKDE